MPNNAGKLPWILVAVGCLLLVATKAAGYWMTNTSMLQVLKHVAAATATVDRYGRWPAGYRGNALHLFHRATNLTDSTQARWGGLRIALISGDCYLAAHLADGLLTNSDKSNPLLFEDILTAYDCSKQYSKLRTVYTSTPKPLSSDYLNDSIALAFLEDDCPESLYTVLSLRPNDLSANYRLWERANRSGEQQQAREVQRLLTYFPLQALTPQHPGLLQHTLEVIPKLLQQGIWQRDQTLNVVSYLVWQCPEHPAVEHLIEMLAETYPTEPEWLQALAELHHRRGDLAQACDLYQQTLEIDQEFAPPYLGLIRIMAEIAETEANETAAWQTRALEWYTLYKTVAPDDPVSLCLAARVTEVDTLNNEPGADTKCIGTDALRDYVADNLGVPPTTVHISDDNLVMNGAFEVWEPDHPEDWEIVRYVGDTVAPALYVHGPDTVLGSEPTARLISLSSAKLEDGSITYAQYVGQSFTMTSAKYLIAITYRYGHASNGTTFVFVGDHTRSGGYVWANLYLPDTEGHWSQFLMMADGPTEPSLVTPLIRNWGMGDLEIWSIEIRSVDILSSDLSLVGDGARCGR